MNNVLSNNNRQHEVKWTNMATPRENMGDPQIFYMELHVVSEGELHVLKKESFLRIAVQPASFITVGYILSSGNALIICFLCPSPFLLLFFILIPI